MTPPHLSDLNIMQLKAVTSVDGPMLVIAGPGSGKTRVITRRIVHLVKDFEVSPSYVAAVTFTNKAAKEMRQRLFGVSPEDTQAPLFAMRHEAASLTTGTFHAFCARMLRQHGELVGLDRNYTIYDDPDQIDVIKRCMAELDVDPKSIHPRAIQSAISGAKSQLISAEGFAERSASYFDEVVGRVYSQYEMLMAQSNAVDFDDLLFKAYLLLRQHETVARRYQERFVHFMVDEFQDTNVAQYAIAKLIAEKHRNLCVVGDPDQSIYSWRNADIRNILSFQKDFPDAKVIALEQNYRSTQTILDAASRLIATNTQRVEKELFTDNGAGSPITVAEGYDESEEAQMVLREISSLTRSSTSTPARYRLGDIAVMYRVNAQSRALEEACLRHGVPYQVVGGMKFYQRQEVKDLAAYLKLITNPNDDVSLQRVINVPSRGIGRRTMDELNRLARDQGLSMFNTIPLVSPESGPGSSLIATPFTTRAIRALGDFRAMIDTLRSAAESTDLVGLIDKVMVDTGYRKHVADLDERSEERLENLDEFKAAARDYTHLGPVEGLTAFLESVSLVSDVDEMEESPDFLTLITLHQAKGLEYPVVFMVGMEDGLLPHARSLDEPAGLEEERRLCYVGITRAKERLYLMRAFRRGFRGGIGPNLPSRFLTDIPRELIAGADRDVADLVAPKEGQGAQRPVRSDRDRPSRRSGGFEFTRRAPTTGPTRPRGSPRSGLSAASPTRRRSARPSPAETTPSYATGDKVRHPAFGEGIVMACEPSGVDFQVTVAFKEGGGVKRLLLSFAPLEKVN